MRYKLGTFKEEEEDKIDYLGKIESKLTLTREETEKCFVKKFTDGKCILDYNGEHRKGIILSMGTKGTYVIGILREED
jgi:hypothetical protein